MFGRMKRFVIVVSGVPVPSKDAFAAYLETAPACSWWHCLTDVWLAVDHGISPLAQKWRELVRTQMVMSLEGGVSCVEVGDDCASLIAGEGYG